MLITRRGSLSSRALGACKSLSRDPSVFSALSLAVVLSSRHTLTRAICKEEGCRAIIP